MQATIPLNLMEQNLNARRGQYQFPFTFQLPMHTPPSFSYRYGDLMCAPQPPPHTLPLGVQPLGSELSACALSWWVLGSVLGP